MKRLQVRAGDYFTAGTRTRYVERVETTSGESRPVWWPGFVLVTRDPAGRVERGQLPRGAREATAAEVARWKATEDALSPALPLDEVLVPTRVYAAPGEPLALF